MKKAHLIKNRPVRGDGNVKSERAVFGLIESPAMVIAKMQSAYLHLLAPSQGTHTLFAEKRIPSFHRETLLLSTPIIS